MDFAAINEGGYADHKYECVCPKQQEYRVNRLSAETFVFKKKAQIFNLIHFLYYPTFLEDGGLEKSGYKAQRSRQVLQIIISKFENLHI